MSADGQTNHLRAYGVVFVALQGNVKVDWLLNYKGGSFAMPYDDTLARLCRERGVAYSKMKDDDYHDLAREVKGLKYDGNVVTLEHAPRIAVYTPLNKEPWDDAVTLALTYAGIPFDKVYADEVLADGLSQYEWLHLHHEDFTGQFGKFWAMYHNAQWYMDDERTARALAARHGYKKVSQMQLAVVKKIRSFVNGGGNLFAMCSATDTYDIALAADSTDICAEQFDGDPADPTAQDKLNFKRCFAFTNFIVFTDPLFYEYSSIDNTNFRRVVRDSDYFRLNTFSAKEEVVPTMLCQNHTMLIRGFMGQTTAFRNDVLKPGALVLAGNDAAREARYIHGEHGKGSWTFYGGHDPEDYQHLVGAPPTDLDYHRNSPGYRLILNNVLLPAVKKANLPQPKTQVTKPEEKEVVNAKVNILTNPATDELIVSYTTPAGRLIKEVLLRNGHGKNVFNKKYDTDKAHVSLSGIASGLYEVVVDGMVVGKFVKE